MGIKERLAAVEAKLGIKSPQDSPIIAWDGEDRFDGSTWPSRHGEGYTDFDFAGNYRHFVYLTPEIVAAIKALPEAKK